MNKLKSTMASKRKAHKYWKGLENTISESKKVMEEQGVDIYYLVKKNLLNLVILV